MLIRNELKINPIELRIYSGRKEKLLYEKLDDPFVRAFIYWLYGHIININLSITDTGNVSRSMLIGYIRCDSGVAGTGITTVGIVVGTGTNAVAINDYALQAKIANGAGAGQLAYLASYVEAFGLYGTTRKFMCNRLFHNASGSSITINEVGIYCVDASSQYFCIARDVIGGGITVDNGSVITVEYFFNLPAV